MSVSHDHMYSLDNIFVDGNNVVFYMRNIFIEKIVDVYLLDIILPWEMIMMVYVFMHPRLNGSRVSALTISVSCICALALRLVSSFE